jgi:hypothetical protein
MAWHSCGLRVARNILPVLVIVTAAAFRSQPTPTLELPLASLQSIASDFDSGLNPIYCYQGGVIDSTTMVIQVDSVTVVPTPDACSGIGIGYISRIDDRAFLAQAARGLINSSARFRVVSAFYGISTVEVNGRSVRAARSLSVLRGNANTVELGQPRRESNTSSDTRMEF